MSKYDLPVSHVPVFKAMSPGSILLKYQGSVTTEVIDSLLAIVLYRLECIEQNINVRKKIYSILMECAQNICLHVDHVIEPDLDTSSGYLSLESSLGGYQIISANFVHNTRKKRLTDMLECINAQKTNDDLKKLYNEVMANKIFGARGGGGLGLIDVARKSTGKLNYSMDTINNHYSFFTLNVAIKKY